MPLFVFIRAVWSQASQSRVRLLWRLRKAETWTSSSSTPPRNAVSAAPSGRSNMDNDPPTKVISAWGHGLKEASATFSSLAKHISALDGALTAQRSTIGTVQADLCSLSALQYRMSFQLEMLESHQLELELALGNLEIEADELVSRPLSSSQLDHSENLLCYAEDMSVQIKGICRKMQEMMGKVDTESALSMHESPESICAFVHTLNQQLRTLTSIDDRITSLGASV